MRSGSSPVRRSGGRINACTSDNSIRMARDQPDPKLFAPPRCFSLCSINNKQCHVEYRSHDATGVWPGSSRSHESNLIWLPDSRFALGWAHRRGAGRGTGCQHDAHTVPTGAVVPPARIRTDPKPGWCYLHVLIEDRMITEGDCAMNDYSVKHQCHRSRPYRALRQALCCVSVLSLVLISGRAAAANVANASILEIAIDPAYGNHVFIRLNVVPTGTACAVSGYWTYTLSFSSTASQQMYAALLAAQMAGKTISVTGAGACNENSAVESMRGMNVQS